MNNIIANIGSIYQQLKIEYAQFESEQKAVEQEILRMCKSGMPLSEIKKMTEQKGYRIGKSDRHLNGNLWVIHGFTSGGLQGVLTMSEWMKPFGVTAFPNFGQLVSHIKNVKGPDHIGIKKYELCQLAQSMSATGAEWLEIYKVVLKEKSQAIPWITEEIVHWLEQPEHLKSLVESVSDASESAKYIKNNDKEKERLITSLLYRWVTRMPNPENKTILERLDACIDMVSKKNKRLAHLCLHLWDMKNATGIINGKESLEKVQKMHQWIVSKKKQLGVSTEESVYESERAGLVVSILKGHREVLIQELTKIKVQPNDEYSQWEKRAYEVLSNIKGLWNEKIQELLSVIDVNEQWLVENNCKMPKNVKFICMTSLLQGDVRLSGGKESLNWSRIEDLFDWGGAKKQIEKHSVNLETSVKRNLKIGDGKKISKLTEGVLYPSFDSLFLQHEIGARTGALKTIQVEASKSIDKNMLKDWIKETVDSIRSTFIYECINNNKDAKGSSSEMWGQVFLKWMNSGTNDSIWVLTESDERWKSFCKRLEDRKNVLKKRGEVPAGLDEYIEKLWNSLKGGLQKENIEAIERCLKDPKEPIPNIASLYMKIDRGFLGVCGLLPSTNNFKVLEQMAEKHPEKALEWIEQWFDFFDVKRNLLRQKEFKVLYEKITLESKVGAIEEAEKSVFKRAVRL